MDRKYLQNIEEPELSEENSALFLLTDEGISFLATTKAVKADDGFILGIRLYAKNLVKKGICKPYAVVYLDGHDYAVRYLLDENGAERKTWGTAEFGRVVKKTAEYSNGFHEMYHTCLLNLSDAGKIRSCIGTEGYCQGISIWQILDRYAEAINGKRRTLQTEEARKRIDSFMIENILPVPRGFQDFADRKVSAGMARKLFAAVDGKKRTTSYFCTKCGEEKTFKTKERPYIEDKGTMICPVCGKRLPVEKIDRRHRTCRFSGWYAFVQPTGQGFVLRTFSKTKRLEFDFSEGRFTLEDRELSEKGRSFYSFKKETWKVQRYEHEWRSSEGTAWYRSYRNGEVSKSSRAGSYYGQLELTGLCLYGDAELYTGNYRTALAGTPLRYNDLRDIAKVAARGGMRCADAVLQTLCEFPKLEWLLKMGLYGLVGYASYENEDDVLNTGGETIYEILGIGKTETRLLMKCGGSIGALKAIKMFKEHDAEARSEKQISFVSEVCGLERYYGGYSAGYRGTTYPDGTFLVRMMFRNGVSMERAESYLRKEMRCGEFDDADDFCGIYKDYYQMADRLGKDFSNRWWLMPNHLQKAHDNVSKEMEMAKQEILERESRRLNGILSELSRKKAEATETDDGEAYTAVFPSTIDEYKADGEALHQCIYTCGYYEKVARGESEIAFIRKRSEPDVPYATLEWRGGKILQLRGFGNGSVPKDVWDYAESLVRRINAFEERVA